METEKNHKQNNPQVQERQLAKITKRKTSFLPFKKTETEQSIVSRFEHIVKKHPDSIAVVENDKSLTYTSLNEEANQLAHHLTDNYDDGFKLTKKEKNRYARQLFLEDWGMESQELLKSLTVFAAGAGGSGSPTIIQLALLGVGTIIVCDFDTLELSNLNRQALHDESRIGMNKAESAALSIKRINPNVNVVTVTDKITKDNIYEIIGQSAIIFDNLDDIESKFVLSECAVSLGIPHVISSMLELSHYAAIFHSPHTPCFHCLYDQRKLEMVREMKDMNQHKSEVSNPVSAPALFASTGFAVNEAVKILLGLKNPAYNKYFFFNQQASRSLAKSQGYQIVTYPFSDHFKDLCKDQGFDWAEGWSGRYVEEINITKNPGCPLCGEEKEIVLREPFNSNIPTKSTAKMEGYSSENTPTVAILIGHNVSMVKGILGTLKAGKTFVTMDPRYPKERLAYILGDTSARVIVTEQEHMDLAIEIRNRVNKNIKIINIESLPEGLSKKNLALILDCHSLAYIMYTSGSTGFPKGVMQKHRNVLHYIMNYTNTLEIDCNDKLSLIPSFSFSAAMMDTFGGLLNGAALYLYDMKCEGFGKLSSWLIDNEISVYHSVPTIFRNFVKTLSSDTKFHNLRVIDLGGETVTLTDLDLYKKHFEDHCILVNGLGSTELNVIRQYHMNKDTELDSWAIPAGYPVEDTEILLLDKNGENIGYNQCGEIVIKSSYLSPGYWEMEKPGVFKELPDTDAILFHTGDLGCFRIDGCLEHMGRKDNQLKIRGIRIEAGEIEKALQEFSHIKEAIVKAVDNEQGEKQLVSYIVLDESTTVTNDNFIEKTRRDLKENLPTYMIPDMFIKLEAMPLTLTGKIDRKALNDITGDNHTKKTGYSNPRNEIDEKLCVIVEEMLKEKVSIYDSFSEIGLNSLKALSLSSEIKDSFGVEISFGQFFDLSQLSKVSDYISEEISEVESLNVAAY